MKKDESKEAGVREREREREREKIGNVCLMREEREVFFFFLTSSYSTQLKIATYCSSKAKIFSYTFTTIEPFLYFSETRIAI